MSRTSDVDVQLDAAIVSHEARDLDQAERLYRDVLRVQPDNAEALNLLGLVLQDRGQVDESIALISRALEIDPEYPEAFANLARGLGFQGKPEMAAEAARKATELDPELGEGWLQLGRALLDLKQEREALAALREASSHLPDATEIYAGIGFAAQRLDQPEDAAEAWRIVLEAEPNRIDGLINLGAAYARMKKFDEALELHRKAVALAPRNVEALAALVGTLYQFGYANEFIPICRTILAHGPARAEILGILAAGQTWLGQLEDAIKSCEAALAVDPGHFPARELLGRLKPDTLDDPTVTLLRSKFDDTSRPVADRAPAGFSVAAALDDAGDFDGAFRMYQAANTLYREEGRAAGDAYNPEEFKAYVDWVHHTFPPSKFAEFRGMGSESELPVFIVGMPRSGTTLVEQILASHPRVYGAGELMDIAHIVARINKVPAHIPVHQWEYDQVHREAEQHIARLTSLGLGADRVIDKMPDNIKVLGHIRLLFPNARIIICHRDPRDVSVSNFTTLFGSGIPWSCDIEDCARHTVETRRLSNYWLSALPGNVTAVEYESLVNNLEAESRRLIAFLGLEWDPACLNFHESDRKVTTASVLQVRKPLYTSSIGKWRRYEAHLGQMLRILEDYPSGASRPGTEAPRPDAVARADGNHPETMTIAPGASSRLPIAHNIHAELARAFATKGDHEQAARAWRRAVAVEPENPQHWRALASELWQLTDTEGTRDAYLRALAAAPEDETTLRQLGDFETMFGRFEEAADYYRRILKRNPAMMSARLGLLIVGKADEAGDLADFQAVLTDPEHGEKDRILAGWALGKALDSAEDHDGAFSAFQIANSTARKLATVRFDGAEFTILIDRLIEAFSENFFQNTAARGDPSELPVFVVGLPRSGSSLVEQILASHASIFGAGERTDILTAAQTIEKTSPTGTLDGVDIAAVRREAAAEVARLRELGGDAVRVIDKLPDNVLWLGYIRMMLPRARIVVCRRDPRDIGLSCYSTHFVDGQEWTTDLTDIATRIRGIDRLIAHWRKVLPGPFMEIQYEDLVADPEGESRRLVDFLGLDWDPACLDFHLTERAVRTASVWQVRQEMYRHSIGRWRKYERHLGPLLDGLHALVPGDDRPAEGRPRPAPVLIPEM